MSDLPKYTLSHNEKKDAWYDNEWGYACRLADIVRMVAGSL